MARLKNVALGDLTYVANGAAIQNTTIGKYCSIGPNCRIGLGIHPSRGFVSTHPAFYSTAMQCPVTFVKDSLFVGNQQINIGNDVWIGTGAMIMDGLSIGDGSIVAAGAIVTKDVPPYAVVAGVPAKLIRFRFGPEDIVSLLSFRWWDREMAWVQRNASELSDINRFREVMTGAGNR